MASSFALNENNELYLDGNGEIVLKENNEQLLQKIKQRLQLTLGEWELAATRGVPWFDNILGARNFDLIENIITNEIGKEEDVKIVNNVVMTMNHETRKLSYSCVISTESGQENFTTEFK